MLINNRIERRSENKYSRSFCPHQFITPNLHPTTIWKYFVFDNSFYPIFAWCWRMVLKLWFDFLGLKLFQCLDFQWKGISAFCLRSKCLFKYELVDDIHAVLIHLGQQLNIYGELKKPFLSVNQSMGKCLICNKDISANDASSLTDDGWKT